FQMNPFSAHPPRTPRTSAVGPARPPSTTSAPAFSADVFTTHEDAQERPRLAHIEQDVELAHDAGRADAAKTHVRREDVWREIIKTSNGRDKALKIIQYTLKVYLLFHNTLARRATLGASRPWQVELLRRVNSTTAGLSLARKCLLLFNWLAPLTEILAENAASVDASATASASAVVPKPLLHTFLHAPPPVLLELLNAAADDAATWARLGLLGRRTGERAARVADWCWFASTLVGLVENGVERGVIGSSKRAVEARLYADSLAGQTAKSQPRNTKIDETELQRFEAQDFWLQVQRAKLLMDLIFVSYDVFRLKRGKAPVQTFSGLASALLSSAKLYDRSRGTLLKA
ncbi:hypothetical protein K488DRAFT_23460, partial [Vararia minispora EC-137]